MLEDEIIQVLMLKESAIQNATKFFQVQTRELIATGGLPNGDALATARVAGILAAKRTSDLIPLCHQLALTGVDVEFRIGTTEVEITATVRTTDRTGVEMEALTAVSVAALTIYDMCKAVSHEMVIGETKLLQKTGGKRTILGLPVYGLVLTGGKSERIDAACVSF